MVDYVEDMIEEFPVKLKGTISTPANDSIFKVVEGKPLSKQRSEVFHTYVAKSLFLAKRGRPDVLPTVAFLCTRVTQSTEQDWHKLCRPPKVATSAVVSAGDVGNIALLVLGCLSTWLAAGAGNINNIRGDGGGGNIARGDGVINNNDINNNGGDNSSG